MFDLQEKKNLPTERPILKKYGSEVANKQYFKGGLTSYAGKQV